MTRIRWRSLLGCWTVGAVLFLVPPPVSAQFPVTIDPVAYLLDTTPVVVVTGTVSCEEDVLGSLIVAINQRVRGENTTDVVVEAFSCLAGETKTWSVSLRSAVGEVGGAEFRPGKAEVVADIFACDGVECRTESGQAEILVLPQAASREL